MRLCVTAVVLSVVLCATSSAPVQTDETSIFLKQFGSSNHDLRSLLERWFTGDIGLRKSLRDLAGVMRGTKSIDDITRDIKDIFGSVSATGRGLTLLLRNVGVHAFHAIVNKILGRDAVAPTKY